MRKKHILLVSFAIFCAFQAFFIAKRIHNYPFMIYDMYSRPEQAAASAVHYLVVADGDTLNLAALPIFTEGRIINNLDIYAHHLRYGEDYWSPALTSRQDRWIDGVFDRSRLRDRSDALLRNSAQKTGEFPAWLLGELEHITGRQITSLVVAAATFDRNAGRVTETELLIRYHSAE
jgi:hypothetical protein